MQTHKKIIIFYILLTLCACSKNNEESIVDFTINNQSGNSVFLDAVGLEENNFEILNLEIPSYNVRDVYSVSTDNINSMMPSLIFKTFTVRTETDTIYNGVVDSYWFTSATKGASKWIFLVD